MTLGEPPAQEWQATQAPLASFGRWGSGLLWKPESSIQCSGSGTPIPEGGNPPKSVFSLSSITLVHVQNARREPLIASFGPDQKAVTQPDPSFNLAPVQYGKIPDDWLVLQRCNPMFSKDKTVAWCEMIFSVTNYPVTNFTVDQGYDGPGSEPSKWSDLKYKTSMGEPAPESVPPDVLGDPTLFQADAGNPDVTWYFATSLQCRKGLRLSMELDRRGEGSYYLPETRIVWPRAEFAGPCGLAGEGNFIRDQDHPAKYNVKTSVKIDGTQFPCGTDPSVFFPSYAPTKAGDFSASLNVGISWVKRAERGL